MLPVFWNLQSKFYFMTHKCAQFSRFRARCAECNSLREVFRFYNGYCFSCLRHRCRIQPVSQRAPVSYRADARNAWRAHNNRLRDERKFRAARRLRRAGQVRPRGNGGQRRRGPRARAAARGGAQLRRRLCARRGRAAARHRLPVSVLRRGNRGYFASPAGRRGAECASPCRGQPFRPVLRRIPAAGACGAEPCGGGAAREPQQHPRHRILPGAKRFPDAAARSRAARRRS